MKKIFYIVLWFFLVFFYGESFAVVTDADLTPIWIFKDNTNWCKENEIICRYTETYNYDNILYWIVLFVISILFLFGIYIFIRAIIYFFILSIIYWIYINWFISWFSYNWNSVEFIKNLIIDKRENCKPKKWINCYMPIKESVSSSH